MKTSLTLAALFWKVNKSKFTLIISSGSGIERKKSKIKHQSRILTNTVRLCSKMSCFCKNNFFIFHIWKKCKYIHEKMISHLKTNRRQCRMPAVLTVLGEKKIGFCQIQVARRGCLKIRKKYALHFVAIDHFYSRQRKWNTSDQTKQNHFIFINTSQSALVNNKCRVVLLCEF